LESRIVACSASALKEERDRCARAGFCAFISKPIRAARVNECLARLAGVVFEAVGRPSTEDTRPELAECHLTIDASLLQRIVETAETYQTTRLGTVLLEVSQLGAAEAAFAERLRRRARSYDMRGIIEDVRRIGGDAEENPPCSAPQELVADVVRAVETAQVASNAKS
jgi:CheY-like chemotaxis protein